MVAGLPPLMVISEDRLVSPRANGASAPKAPPASGVPATADFRHELACTLEPDSRVTNEVHGHAGNHPRRHSAVDVQRYDARRRASHEYRDLRPFRRCEASPLP